MLDSKPIVRSGPEVIIFPSCSTQLSMKFQLLITTKMLKNIDFSCFKLSDVVFIMLMNVKMPTIVDILTFMSMINCMLINVKISTIVGILTFMSMKNFMSS